MAKELNDIIDFYSKACVQGYYSVLIISLGRQIGIFEYLAKIKNIDSRNKKSKIVYFSPELVAKDLKLDKNFLDAWFHMGIELGIFNIKNGREGILETAPYTYEFFIDVDSPFYIGNLYGWIYKAALIQDSILKSFKTGKIIERLDDGILEIASRDGQKLGMIKSNARLRLFSKNLKEYHQKLRERGLLLEIGCGIGINLLIWAKKYKNANFIGIDPNPKVISYLKEIIKNNNLEEQIEAINYSLNEYLLQSEHKTFDIIILNEVLHEILGDDSYRKEFLNNIYELLKDDGILIIGEEMVPKTYEVIREKNFWSSIAKWDEVFFGARHYDEKSFIDLIKSTNFRQARILQDENVSLWIITKK